MMEYRYIYIYNNLLEIIYSLFLIILIFIIYNFILKSI